MDENNFKKFSKIDAKEFIKQIMADVNSDASRKRRQRELECQKGIFSQISMSDKIYFLENYIWGMGLRDVRGVWGNVYHARVWLYPVYWDFKDVVERCVFKRSSNFFCYAMFDDNVNKMFREEIEKFVIGRWYYDFNKYEKLKKELLEFKHMHKAGEDLTYNYYCKNIDFKTIYSKFKKIYFDFVFDKYLNNYDTFPIEPNIQNSMFVFYLCNGGNPDHLLSSKILDNYDEYVISQKNEILKGLKSGIVNYLYLAVKYKVKLESLIIIHSDLEENRIRSRKKI